jgi:methylmalonyl-CoA/ethylmalonyl-CoA epimerase
MAFSKNFSVPHINEEVASEGVTTSFKSGPNKIELLAATNPESPIAKFIEKKEEFTISLLM